MKGTSCILSILCFLIAGIEGKAQDVHYAKNSIYLELGGNGGIYSFNYERNFLKSINCRAGFSYYSQSWGFSSGTIKTRTVPLTITWMSGKKANHFEIGGGVLFKNEHKELDDVDYFNKFIDITAFVGYRYQKPGGGYLFRIGLTPFFPTYRNYRSMLSCGASFGIHF